MPSEKLPLLPPRNAGKYVLVIHGGAGTMSRKTATPARRAAYHAALRKSLEAGYKVLAEGGEAMDAVVEAVSVMEDNPLFNAGKGAVFNVDGKNELESSIILSKPPASHSSIPPTRRGISLTLLTRVRNPSKAARTLYLTPSAAPHPFLSGATAEAIAESLGEELVDPSYFYTDRRWKEHRRGLGLPDEPFPEGAHHDDPDDEKNIPPLDMNPTGTVGAVALDVRGCIASLTSTGGRTNKLVGRIGDTPVMAAGFWAEEWEPAKRGSWVKRVWDKVTGKSKSRVRAVGISGTGNGDYFIRKATAATITHRVKFLGETIQEAAEQCVEELRIDGGEGGVIALDNKGNVATPLNCSGMYRGVIREDGLPKTAIFDDEKLE